MAARRRKTLVVCRHYHEAIHAGRSSIPFRKEARQQMALRYVHIYGSITSNIHQKLTVAGENTATRDLEALVGKGVAACIWGAAGKNLRALMAASREFYPA
jgi:hypothetical protein